MTTAVSRPRVFLDIQIGTLPAGRVVVELFVDKTPKTCENFRSLCALLYTPPGASKALTYKNSPLHRVIDEFMIQGGDITARDGTGGQSIYGGDFEDENIGWREIDTAGLVCMANRGKGTNSSQFFITLAPCQHLNAKHTVFGHVVMGMDTVDRIAKVEVDNGDKPVQDVFITHCGELEQRKKLKVTSHPAPIRNNGDNKHTGFAKRGRKRPQSPRQPSRSPSRAYSASPAEHPEYHKKYRKRSKSPGASPPRRRSDFEIDETRRGRARTRSRSLEEPGKEVAREERRQERKRNPSPSRSRSRPRSLSPHLRRQHTRSRERSPFLRALRSGHDHSRRDESWIRREEEEREGGQSRFDGVLDSGYIRKSKRPTDHYRPTGQSPYRKSQGRLGGNDSGDGGEHEAGEVQFKGRGSMKYKE
ncbi:hypothetical protein MMC13_006882 [Lambiella insularis]|nr:hypothetical protein [Lambiella insularis]